MTFSVRMGWRALLLYSILLVLMNSAFAQAQNTTAPALKDFPIGLVLEYDLHNWTTDGFDVKSHVKYEVIGWLVEQEIVEIRYSGGWYGSESSGVQCIGLPNWTIVDSNGTETGGFMDPLWMNITALASLEAKIPAGNPQSLLYCRVEPVTGALDGTVTSWECMTTWYEGGNELQKELYYESALGVLVVMSEDCIPSYSGGTNGNTWS